MLLWLFVATTTTFDFRGGGKIRLDRCGRRRGCVALTFTLCPPPNCSVWPCGVLFVEAAARRRRSPGMRRETAAPEAFLARIALEFTTDNALSLTSRFTTARPSPSLAPAVLVLIVNFRLWVPALRWWCCCPTCSQLFCLLRRLTLVEKLANRAQVSSSNLQTLTSCKHTKIQSCRMRSIGALTCLAPLIPLVGCLIGAVAHATIAFCSSLPELTTARSLD